MGDGVVGELSAHVLGRVLAFVASRGGDPDALCRAVGIAPASLRIPGARVPYTVVESLGVLAQRQLDDPHFGLHLGQFTVGTPDTVEDPGMLLAPPLMIGGSVIYTWAYRRTGGSLLFALLLHAERT